ncbi:unnamed protein product [Allacma fusca]|uniref:Cytokine-inducible SH2-containing protein n=1 Tax=Allacma fusca TaxID=39272 RepID=A0A8J2LT28_9HEXA|nr:unnamed protein product [Allacma fusca]
MPSQILSFQSEMIPFRPQGNIFSHSKADKAELTNSRISVQNGINRTKELLGIGQKVPGHVCGIYCTECEIATKKYRTQLLSAGGHMIINSSSLDDISVNNWMEEEEHNNSSNSNSNSVGRSHDRKSNLVVNVRVPEFNKRTHRLVISFNLENKISDDLNLIARNLSQLKESGWFFDNLNYQEAQNLLSSAQPGTFLLRNSSDPRYLFSLSVQTDRGPTSVRINYVNCKFQLDADDKFNEVLPKDESVIALLELHVRTARRTGQVWVEPNGKYYSPVVLSQPLRKKVPTLQHLSRLVLNRTEVKTSAMIPPGIKNYLTAYPFLL